MVGPAPITCSISRWICSWRMIWCSAVGITKPLTTSASAAVTSEMRRLLHQRLPGDRNRERDGLQCEHVDDGHDAVLVKQQEAQDQHAAGEQMGDVEQKLVVHQNPCGTNRRNTASAAAANAPPTKIG